MQKEARVPHPGCITSQIQRKGENPRENTKRKMPEKCPVHGCDSYCGKRRVSDTMPAQLVCRYREGKVLLFDKYVYYYKRNLCMPFRNNLFLKSNM